MAIFKVWKLKRLAVMGFEMNIRAGSTVSGGYEVVQGNQHEEDGNGVTEEDGAARKWKPPFRYAKEGQSLTLRKKPSR